MLCKTMTVGLLGVNCVILADEESHEAAVVDPGGDVPQILMQLTDLGLKVAAILLTHGHVDHVSGVGELARVTHAPTYMHEGDKFLFDTIEQQAAMFGLPVPEPGSIDMPLGDGDRVTFGAHALEVMHTPGHSPGSVSLLVTGQNTVLCGDTLFAGGIGRTDVWGGSFETLAQSIKERLYSLDDSTRVIPGHGPTTTIGKERRSNPFVRG